MCTSGFGETVKLLVLGLKDQISPRDLDISFSLPSPPPYLAKNNNVLSHLLVFFLQRLNVLLLHQCLLFSRWQTAGRVFTNHHIRMMVCEPKYPPQHWNSCKNHTHYSCSKEEEQLEDSLIKIFSGHHKRCGIASSKGFCPYKSKHHTRCACIFSY